MYFCVLSSKDSDCLIRNSFLWIKWSIFLLFPTFQYFVFRFSWIPISIKQVHAWVENGKRTVKSKIMNKWNVHVDSQFIPHSNTIFTWSHDMYFPSLIKYYCKLIIKVLGCGLLAEIRINKKTWKIIYGEFIYILSLLFSQRRQIP